MNLIPNNITLKYAFNINSSNLSSFIDVNTKNLLGFEHE